MILAEIPSRRISGVRAVAELAALVRESLAANALREVLHFRPAALPSRLRRPHHQPLLRDALEPVLAASRTELFDLPNGDIIVVAPPPATALEEAQAALRRTLDLTATNTALRRLRLPQAAAELLIIAAESSGLEPCSRPPAPDPAVNLGSAELAAAERAVAQADLEPMTQVQTVCRLEPDGSPPVPLWEDRRVAWPLLAAALLPDYDLAATPGLRRRLGRVAEARLLAELARPTAQLAWRPVGVPLALATLTGPAFARFEAALPAGRRQEVTIGCHPADILATPASFLVMRDALRGRGFRLALDDAAPGVLALLRPAQLGLDLLRLRWSPELPGAMPEAVAQLLAEPGGTETVVLAGVDRPAAIGWGWEAGFRCFQGPLVERRRRGV